MGQQDYKAAQDIFGNVVTLTLILGVLFSIVALVFLDPIPTMAPNAADKFMKGNVSARPEMAKGPTP